MIDVCKTKSGLGRAKLGPGKPKLDPGRPKLGIESIFFRILTTLCRPCFLIILVPKGVKTKDLDILWQKIQFLTV